MIIHTRFFQVSQIVCILVIYLIVSCDFYVKASEFNLNTTETENDKTDAVLPRTDPKMIGIVYQILKVVDFELNNHNIPYWIDFGTLLGSIRHGGIIPWDDDGDICILLKDIEKLLEIAPIFENYGLELTVWFPNCLFKIHRKGKVKPFVDVFFMYYDQQLDHYRPYKCLGASNWKKNDLFPLRKIQCGPLVLNCTNEGIIPHLERFYGLDFMENAIFWNHSKTGIGRIKVKLVDYSPAEYEITEDIIDIP